jgi:hypothetical protein
VEDGGDDLALGILPPLTLPQEIRGHYFWGHLHHIYDAWRIIEQRFHPDLQEKWSCKECARPSLADHLCCVCRWVKEDYERTLYG